jgi:DNA-binding LacI/PurR family transcriptional regulator
VTLRDIAQAVGVDVSTVSKVLNASGSITVRPETRQRILDEVARTGYRPNAAARSLKIQRTGALGMVFPDLTNPLYATIARGAVRRAAELGYVMLVAELSDDDTSMLGRLVLERRIDGLMVATAQEVAGGGIDGDASLIPFVYVNRRVGGANRSVIVDDEAAAALAADTLIEAGHRRLAFVGGPSEIDTARRRRAGFAAACARAGLEAPLDVVRPYSRAGGREAAGDISLADPAPTAIFASNLLVAIGLLAGLREAGLRVPGDVSVITLEDEEAAYTAPPLTAVWLPFAHLGATSVDELHRMLEGQLPRDVVVSDAPRIVQRASLRRL